MAFLLTFADAKVNYLQKDLQVILSGTMILLRKYQIL